MGKDCSQCCFANVCLLRKYKRKLRHTLTSAFETVERTIRNWPYSKDYHLKELSDFSERVQSWDCPHFGAMSKQK